MKNLMKQSLSKYARNVSVSMTITLALVVGVELISFVVYENFKWKRPIFDERAREFPNAMGVMEYKNTVNISRRHAEYASDSYNISSDGFRSTKTDEHIFANYSSNNYNIFAFGRVKNICG